MTYYKEQNGKELGNFRLSTVTAFWPASSSVDSPKPELAAFAFAVDCQVSSGRGTGCNLVGFLLFFNLAAT